MVWLNEMYDEYRKINVELKVERALHLSNNRFHAFMISIIAFLCWFPDGFIGTVEIWFSAGLSIMSVVWWIACFNEWRKNKKREYGDF